MNVQPKSLVQQNYLNNSCQLFTNLWVGTAIHDMSDVILFVTLTKIDILIQPIQMSNSWMRNMTSPRYGFVGPRGESLVKKCISKLKRCMKDKNIKFIVMYDTKKMAFFCSNKEKTPDSSNIAYEFSYPRCCAKYVGKTERCFYTRNENSAVLKHSRNCADFQHTVDLHALPLIFSDSYKLSPSIMQHVQSAVFNHTRITDRNNNWSELCILESLHIKRRNPIPNVGVKATKQGFPPWALCPPHNSCVPPPPP